MKCLRRRVVLKRNFHLKGSEFMQAEFAVVSCSVALELLLRYTAENSQVTWFLRYALSVHANKIFQKRTVFMFTES